MQAENSSVMEGDSEDDFDWEEVVVPPADPQPDLPAEDNDVQEGPSEPRNIEITIKTYRKQDTPKYV